MNDKIEMINLDLIEPHPANRRLGGFDQGKLEQLAESIKSVGVQQPAIIRKLPENQRHLNLHSPTETMYQLVAGERRWRASKIAGNDSLPCIVRDLDDVTALKIQTIENLQRDDIHPLDEADGYHQLITQAEYTVETIAAEVGKSPSYVYQRMKLTSLVDEIKELFVENRITAGHAILIARLGPDQQREILEENLFDRWNNVSKTSWQPVSVRDLNDYIQENIMLDLSKTTWKMDDAELYPEAGSCRECAKRTGYQPALFADVCKDGKQRDYCTDKNCFQAKQDLVVKAKEAELAGQDILRVIDGYLGYGVKAPKNTLQQYEWKECKKSEPGAKKVLVVGGHQPGRVIYGVPIDRCGNGQRYQQSPEEKAKAKKERDKAAAAEKARIAKLDGVLEMAAAQGPELPLEAMRICVNMIWTKLCDFDRQVVIARHEGWAKKATEVHRNEVPGIQSMDKAQLNRLLLMVAMAGEVKCGSYCKPSTKTMDALTVVFDSSAGDKKEAV